MMRYLFIICLFVVCGSFTGKSQEIPSTIYLTDCGVPEWQSGNAPGWIPFCAIQDKSGSGNFGRIHFTPDGGNHWKFSWTYNGAPQFVGYEGDSTSLVVDIQGSGEYAFRAEKDGREIESGLFRIFYVHVPDFTLSLLNVDDCEEFIIKVDNFVPPFYDSNGQPYYGTRTNVEYLVSGRSVPILIPGYRPVPMEISAMATVKDATYTVTVTDLFGFSWKSSEVKYSSVVPKADFNVDPSQGEAPLDVKFENRSENAQRYEWYLYRDSVELKQTTMYVEDSLMDNRIVTEANFLYTYEHPGDYNVKLIAYNTAGANQCSDTMVIAKYIIVDTSLVDVPNVFTPNGDGANDVFKAKAASLASFHGVIINRWGRKVFEWSNIDDGWNGRINGKLAAPGTYYYIITARGLDRITKKYIKKGPLLLVR